MFWCDGKQMTIKLKRDLDMKNKTILSICCFVALLTAAIPAFGDNESDPRFFGDFYGTYTESYTIRVRVWFFGWHTIREERKSINCDIEARIEYDETESGQGLVVGGGNVDSNYEDIRFGFNGYVTGYGRIRGSGTASNMEYMTATGTLSSDGNRLTLRAMGRTVVLHRDTRNNTAPTVRIVSPESGHREHYGTPLLLSARIADAEDGTIDPDRIVWSSNIDGRLGTGSTQPVVLSPGAHLITVSATDSGGLSAASIQPLVIENHAPNPPQILQPAPGSRFTNEQSIVFRGMATDAEDGMLRGDSLIWGTDLSGSFGHGNLITRRLPVGRHRISLTATDHAGQSSTTTVGIEVYRNKPEAGSPPSIRILAPSDLAALSSMVTFRAEADDPEDGRLSGESIRWTDRYLGPDGEINRTLGDGAVLSIADLYAAPGDTRHQIVATATDSDGNMITDQITIYIIYGGLY